VQLDGTERAVERCASLDEMRGRFGRIGGASMLVKSALTWVVSAMLTLPEVRLVMRVFGCII
jgi:hypothetical protein